MRKREEAQWAFLKVKPESRDCFLKVRISQYVKCGEMLGSLAELELELLLLRLGWPWSPFFPYKSGLQVLHSLARLCIISIFNAQFLKSNGIKLRQTIEKTPRYFLRMLNTELAFNLAIPPLGTHPGGMQRVSIHRFAHESPRQRDSQAPKGGNKPNVCSLKQGQAKHCIFT